MKNRHIPLDESAKTNSYNMAPMMVAGMLVSAAKAA